MTTYASLFTGGGLADWGARAAGLKPVWGVEYDPAIAAVAQQNDDTGTVYAADVRAVDYAALPRVDVLHASPPCFPAGTTVLTKRGLVPIEAIVVGDEVLTHVGRYMPVTHIMSRTAPTITLHGQGHWGLEVTPNHPFLSSSRTRIYPPHKERRPGNYVQHGLARPEWVAAEDMTGKHWLSHTVYPELPIPPLVFRGNEGLRGQSFEWAPELFWIIGAWVGDGWVRYAEGGDGITPRGEVLICAGKHEAVILRNALTAAHLRFAESDERTTTRFTISSRPFARWLTENFGRYAHGKHIPAWLLGMPISARRAFFEGYVFADGSTTHPDTYDREVVVASTVSYQLAIGLRMLALTLGYATTLKRYARNRVAQIESRDVQERPTYMLRFARSERHSFVLGGYRSGGVRRIEAGADMTTVYDITVAEDESFVADGIIVHNCPNFSVAKTGRGETDTDLDLARAVARAIDAQRPRLVTLENVRAYQDSRSLGVIMATLDALDYHVTTAIVNAADMGVPQTRERLFVIAHAGGWMQAARPLPAPTAWRGWYDAIADLIPTLPPSRFAAWQLARLPDDIRETMLFGNSLRHDFSDSPKWRPARLPSETLTTEYRPSHMPRAFLMMSNVSGLERAEVGQGMRGMSERAPTCPAGKIAQDARAFLVGDQAASEGRGIQVCEDDAPAMTVRAGDGAPRGRAWLDAGRVVAMTPRALARFQSLPDAYALPEKASLACRIIGNGVAVEAYRRLLESQL